MFRRTAIVLLILFESLWLNVIVPGHTRGIVQMPSGNAVAVSPCCAPRQTKGKPTQQETAPCAVCSFAAHFGTTPNIDCRPEPLTLTAIVIPTTSIICAIDPTPAAHCRGPPSLNA